MFLSVTLCFLRLFHCLVISALATITVVIAGENLLPSSAGWSSKLVCFVFHRCEVTDDQKRIAILLTFSNIRKKACICTITVDPCESLR